MPRSSHPSRVLVIGWGFVGGAIGEELVRTGHRVVGLTRSDNAASQAARRSGVDILSSSADDPHVLDEAMAGVDHVIYAAGGLLPPTAAAKPAADAVEMLSPLLAALESVRRHRIAGLTYISSGGTVYGNPESNPVREDHPLRPISPYGVSRAAAEMYVQMYARTSELSVRVVRCANVYGPGQPFDRGQGAVAVFLHRIAEGAPLRIIGDGLSVRDYVYIDDIARAVVQLTSDRSGYGTLNLGSGRGHNVLELAECVSEVVGRPAVLEFEPGRPYDVDRIVLDISRVREIISYDPVDLSTGLAATWEARDRQPVSADPPRAN